MSKKVSKNGTATKWGLVYFAPLLLVMTSRALS